jgi:DNA-binding NarL/FixJ family response regulator
METSGAAATSSVSRLLVFGERPVVRVFLGALRAELVPAEMHPDAVTKELARTASAAVVDVAPDPPAAVAVCRELRRRRDDLPIAAVVCCPHSLTPWTLRALLGAGVTGILDLRATPEEAARTVESVALGASVLSLELRRGHRELLQEIVAGPGEGSETKTRLLALVALGLSDREIGAQLHLSPHTVKHQIEQLRRQLRIRNRTELAAWAGRHGFYDGGALANGKGDPMRPSARPEPPPT